MIKKTTRLTCVIACLAIATCARNVENFRISGDGASSQINIQNKDLAPKDSSELKRIEIWPRVKSAIPLDNDIEEHINRLLGLMTVEEKVGQILQLEMKQATPKDVKDFHIGSILNGGGSFPNSNKYATASDWVEIADAYYSASMDDSDGHVAIPVVWGSDAVHGNNNIFGATLFPHNIGLGAARNPALLKRIGKATAAEVAATGIDWIFTPTVATVRNDLWGRSYESYSEDPEIVKAYSGMIVAGIQGTGGTPQQLDSSHLLATAKHFIGDGGTRNGIDRGDNIVSEQDLFDIHGQGYVAALKAGVQTIMVSFNSWKGMPLHGSYYLLTTVLKEKMGFDGVVVSDWNGHSFIENCSSVSCPAAINAGIDLLMAPQQNWKILYKNTLRDARKGIIPQARLNDAVRRLLRVKMRAGLFDSAPSIRPLSAKEHIIGASAHRILARQAVRESLVLLKNKNSLLPLQRQQNVLVCGDGADNIGKQSGGWTLSWQGTGNSNNDFPGASSVFSGIRAIVNSAGGQARFNENCGYESPPDVAIVVYGENPYAEGQGDLDSLEYQPGTHRDLALLKKLKNDGIKVISIFLSGRPLWVNAELNASDAFVAAWLPGSEGQGIADVIFRSDNGDINYDFTGKLSFSWPKDVSQTTLNRGDSPYQPLFPYGYGLNYQDRDALGDNLSEIVSETSREDSNHLTKIPAVFSLTFEDNSRHYKLSGFDGGATTAVTNPHLSHINNSTTAVKIKKFSGQTWGGSIISLEGIAQLSDSNIVTVKVWSSRAVPLLLKLEGVNIQQVASHSGSSAWEILSFDFSNVPGGTVKALTLIFDNGTMGNAATSALDWTFYIDDISVVSDSSPK